MQAPPLRVLIVEDEEILATNLKTHLERRSCEPRIAPDGATAIALAENFSPQVVVFDYRLPDMTGFDVFDAIGRFGGRRFVLITGHPTSTVIKAASMRGIDSVLFKPFPLAELSAVVCEPFPEPGALPVMLGRNVPVERRHHKRDDFPMRLFDGTWLLADRRHHDGDDREHERGSIDGKR